MGEINIELMNMFLEESQKNLQRIGLALEKIKINNIDKEAINSLLISSHGLEGDSLLAKKYLLAYLACKINYIVTKCTAENEGIITEKILSELLVYYDSLRRALQGVLQEKNA